MLGAMLELSIREEQAMLITIWLSQSADPPAACGADHAHAGWHAANERGLALMGAAIHPGQPQRAAKGAECPAAHVVVVAKSGGNFNTITAALNSITDAVANNRYLVWVALGTYTEPVTMKPFVDIEGAGEDTTTISQPGSATLTGTLVGANNAALRSLTVRNTGGAANAIAIYNSAASPTLLHVTASASGGTLNNVGVHNGNSSAPTINDVTASASGGVGSIKYGVRNNNSGATINNSVISTAGGDSYGIYNESAAGIITIRVTNSRIAGDSSTVSNEEPFEIYIATSQLAGGSVVTRAKPGPNGIFCYADYD